MFVKSLDGKTGSILGIPEIEADLKTSMKARIDKFHPEVVTYKDAEGNDLKVFVDPVISEPVV